MNTKTIVVALSVVGGLIGLGLLVNCLVQEEPKVDIDEKSKEAANRKKQLGQKTEVTKSSTANTESVANNKSPEPKNDSKIIADSFTPQEKVELIKSEPQKPEQTSAQELPVADEFPLRLGSKGPNVERLQVFLLRNYGLFKKIPGLFDEQTAAELKRRLNKTELDESTFQKYRMGKHVHEQVIIR